MINFDEPFSSGISGGRLMDSNINLIFPWYTRSFLKELDKWDKKNWKVFEYGSGDSTKWWKNKSKLVISVDSDENWSRQTGAFFTKNKEEFINYPLNFINDYKFDCIIIDGDPVEWRDECTEIAISCLKNNGILIIDNYNQASIKADNYPKTDILLKDKEKYVFNQIGHPDWKTAYWII